ncbi:toll/interleukin-1 receptor domain-containing protein [Mycolicibacterium tusciae]|uniref:TIR domain-containing protein n=1 Tax=Mycolicibacterium tusciae TaxID=75922 RepID=A0A1X0K0X0_9MYCO|nr:toll/interleukin-1 receptor domain-containing protein [Mycolicibacterium tusciae]ORB68784.1 hypothetical protein BST47_02535 [Mycolicibacterium tusciae]
MAVFLSYHNSRLETVAHVANYLARHQIDTWYAPRDIPSGAVWGQAIANAIRNCDALVLLFDASADTSKHIHREVDLADRAHIPIHWLRLDDVEPDELNYYLGTIQWIDWLDKRDEALDRLVRTLTRDVRKTPVILPAPSPPPEEDPLRKPAVLAPYVEWQPRHLTEVADDTIEEIIDGLVDIVATEGPILAHHAYRIYVKASGGHRVGKNVEEILTRATGRAVRTKRLTRIKDRLRKGDKTLYLPGTSPAHPRTLGPRGITDVPRSEIQALASALGLPFDSATTPRAVADQFGIQRLSDDTVNYIDTSLAYKFAIPSTDVPDEDDEQANLGDCEGAQRRLRRLGTILAEATDLATENYPAGAVVMFPSDQVITVQRANLWIDDAHVRLTMTPAELAAQYKKLYSDADTVEALIALADDDGWALNPNFHLAFRFAHGPQRWYPPRYISGPDYVRQWTDDLRDGRAGGRTKEQLRAPEFRHWLVERTYANKSDLPSLDDWLNDRPAGTQLHIRPSVEIRRSWQLTDAITSDAVGDFIGEVRAAIDRVLAALGEPILDQISNE